MRANTRCRYSLAVLLLLAMALLTFSILPAHAQETGAASAVPSRWNYAELQKAPEKTRLRPNPSANDPDAVRAGGKLFEQHCADCHGRKAEGRNHAPSLIHDEIQQATPGTLFWVLTNGVVWHGMPVWSKLPEAQRWQLVAFLQSFRKPAKAEATGDLNNK
jgi:mono/diheme cytochrome c family protein